MSTLIQELEANATPTTLAVAQAIYDHVYAFIEQGGAFDSFDTRKKFNLLLQMEIWAESLLELITKTHPEIQEKYRALQVKKDPNPAEKLLFIVEHSPDVDLTLIGAQILEKNIAQDRLTWQRRTGNVLNALSGNRIRKSLLKSIYGLEIPGGKFTPQFEAELQTGKTLAYLRLLRQFQYEQTEA